jgi:hypothetical protein
MVACDFDLKFDHVLAGWKDFAHVHAGWKGSTSDARVLHDALKHGFEVSPDKKLPFRHWLDKYITISRCVSWYHLSFMRERARQMLRKFKELCNLRCAILRQHIGMTISIVKLYSKLLY